MIKPNYKNVLLFILMKYLLFYIFLMLKNENYTLIRINDLKTSDDWFYYLWIFLFMPCLVSIFFSAPIYFSFRIKKFPIFVFLIGVIFLAEYFLYTYFASQTDLINGVYNGVISVLLFVLFFYKHIALLFKQFRK